MMQYLGAQRRRLLAIVLVLLMCIAVAAPAFARPRFGGGGFRGGGFRSSGGFRGGGSIGSSRPSGGGWFSARPSTSSTSATARTGGFRNGSTIGANTPPVIASPPRYGAPGSGTPHVTTIYHNTRPAYGGNYYVYDHRPMFVPMFLYRPPLYSPYGVVVHHGGFDWAVFLFTLISIGVGIAVVMFIVSRFRATPNGRY